MKEFESFPTLGKKQEETERDEEELYQERAAFLKENYPLEDSNYDVEDILNDSLDGKEVMEKRDGSGDIEGFLTYAMEEDPEKTPYCSMGIALTREESRGEGVMDELFEDVKNVAEEKGCEYIVATADTLGGEEFLLSRGFFVDFDKVTDRNYFRLDLE